MKGPGSAKDPGPLFLAEPVSAPYKLAVALFCSGDNLPCTMATAKYESQFTVNTTGETTGESYKGLFKVKTRLSHRDHLNRDRIRREMIGSNPESASDRAKSIGEIFSQLAVRLVDAPSWWTNSEGGIELADDNVVAEIYGEAIKAEQDEIARVVKVGDAAKKDLQKAE